MRITLLLTAILFLFSCRKDNMELASPKPPCDTTFIFNYTGDTIYPSDYLMAYPGSWWQYDIGTLNCTQWLYTATYTQSKNADDCLEITTKYSYMPWMENSWSSISGKLYPIWGDSFLQIDSNTYKTRIYKYALSYGEKSFTPGNTGGSDQYKWEHKDWFSCDSLFSTIELNGNLYEDVIYVHHKHLTYFLHTANGPTVNYGYYFAKNIGLVKQTWEADFGGIYERNLVDYYIAPH